MPRGLYDVVRSELVGEAPTYARVTMPLGALLEGEFFARYVKEGGAMMVARGTDEVFVLREGVLTLRMGKETYERAGLVGRPEGAKGGRGTRARWLVEVDFRAPAMRGGGGRGLRGLFMRVGRCLGRRSRGWFGMWGKVCGIGGDGGLYLANYRQGPSLIRYSSIPRSELSVRRKSRLGRRSVCLDYGRRRGKAGTKKMILERLRRSFMSGCL